MEALAVSSKVAARVIDSMSREATDYARKSFDDAFAMVRSLTEVRSPHDLIRLQTDYARTAFENVTAFSNAMGEALTRIANEVTSPLARANSVEPEAGSDR